MIRRPDGSSSFNLFNIKADSRWDGDRISIRTLEYEDGIATRQQAAFRAYDSIGASVSDYVNFLRSNPRYRQALEQAADPEAYLQGLKDAGYATDPDYVQKISDIMQQSRFREEVADLSLAQENPIG